MTQPTHLRADAQRNHDKLVATARAVFAERGLDAPLDDVAKRAGLGSGTLYRHFPTRDDLITAVFLDRMAENVAAADRARDHPDPWRGFADYVRETCLVQASDRGMADLMAIGHRGRELRTLRTRAFRGFTALVDRARAAGALRADFTPEDLVLLMMGVAGIAHYMGPTAPAAADRLIALAIDGLRADAATPAPAAISPRTMISRLREAAKPSTTPDRPPATP